MATADEENYLRATLLLLKGCRYIVLKVLYQAADKEKRTSGKDLDGILNDSKDKLKHKYSYAAAREKLFPSDGKAKPETWDISMITDVIVKCYKREVTSAEAQQVKTIQYKKQVKTIQYKRNTVHAHAATASLSTDDYRDVCSELENAIKILSTKFDQSVRDESSEIVGQCLRGTLEAGREEVRRAADYDNLCQELRRKIEQLEQENTALRELVKRQIEQREDSSFARVQVIDTILEISGPRNDGHNITVAERILSTVLNEAIRRVGSQQEVNAIRRVVDEILDEVERGGVRPLETVVKCILLRLECSSYSQLQDLLDLCESQHFQRLLHKLADELKGHMGLQHPLHISFRIAQSSTVSLLQDLGYNKAQKRTIRLPAQCHNVKGVAHLWKYFEEGGATNVLKKLSKAISQQVGNEIMIKASLDHEQVSTALEEPGDTLPAALRHMAGKAVLSESIYQGSTEDVVWCFLCSTAGKTKAASVYCLHCKDNVCWECLQTHAQSKGSVLPLHLGKVQSMSATRSGRLDIPNKCTEICDGCHKEVIEFFCQDHSALVCGKCLAEYHKTCSMDDIPRKSVGVLASDELNRTLARMNEVIAQADVLEKIVADIKSENEKSMYKIISEIEEYQKKMNERLEKLKSQLIMKAENIQDSQNERADKVIAESVKVYNNLKRLHSKIELKKAQDKKCDVYTYMKHAQGLLESYEPVARKWENSEQSVRYIFRHNKALEDLLSKESGLGELLTENASVEKIPSSLKDVSKVTVRTKTDKSVCSVTGCAVLSQDRLLIVDKNNVKLKIVDLREKEPVEELALEKRTCFAVVVLPNNEAAVTQPEDSEIAFVKTSGLMRVTKNVVLGRQCFGISYSDKQELIYVVCVDPCCVITMSLKGTEQKRIVIDNSEGFGRTKQIAFSVDNQDMYISDSSLVARVTVDGKIKATYKSGMDDLGGLAVVDDGSLVVSCQESGLLHQISSDLKHGQNMKDKIPGALSICCMKETKRLFIGALNSDEISVVSILT